MQNQWCQSRPPRPNCTPLPATRELSLLQQSKLTCPASKKNLPHKPIPSPQPPSALPSKPATVMKLKTRPSPSSRAKQTAIKLPNKPAVAHKTPTYPVPNSMPPPTFPASATRNNGPGRPIFHQIGRPLRTPAADQAARPRRSPAAAKKPPLTLAIPGEPFDAMRDIHANLRLRDHVTDSFHLLVWRHVLSSNVPGLEQLAHIVDPQQSRGVPLELCPVIVSFLHTYGPLLWPERTRSHLVGGSTRLVEEGFWEAHNGGYGHPRPYYKIDSVMTANALREWQNNSKGSRRWPSDDESMLHSPLGQLMRVYMFAMLKLSTEDEDKAYERAIGKKEGDLLHEILVADENTITWAPYLAHDVYQSVERYLADTGGMAGLPIVDIAHTREAVSEA